jgi:hypothetical protein
MNSRTLIITCGKQAMPEINRESGSIVQRLRSPAEHWS